jgi:hypothetical protein
MRAVALGWISCLLAVQMWAADSAGPVDVEALTPTILYPSTTVLEDDSIPSSEPSSKALKKKKKKGKKATTVSKPEMTSSEMSPSPSSAVDTTRLTPLGHTLLKPPAFCELLVGEAGHGRLCGKNLYENDYFKLFETTGYQVHHKDFKVKGPLRVFVQEGWFDDVITLFMMGKMSKVGESDPPFPVPEDACFKKIISPKSGQGQTRADVCDHIKTAMETTSINFENPSTVYSSKRQFPTVVRDKETFYRGLGQLVGVVFCQKKLLEVADATIGKFTQELSPKEKGITISIRHVAYYLLIHLDKNDQYAKRLFSKQILVSFKPAV